MYLIQLLLPLYDNQQQRFPREFHDQVKAELTEQFGGVTIYMRAPATGLWKEDSSKIVKDDIVIYEVMDQGLDRVWWQHYRETLEARFEQEVIIARATLFEQL
jgi:hypothetical protein